MADSVARTVGALLVLCIKRNAIGRSPRKPDDFFTGFRLATANLSPWVVAALSSARPVSDRSRPWHLMGPRKNTSHCRPPMHPVQAGAKPVSTGVDYCQVCSLLAPCDGRTLHEDDAHRNADAFLTGPSGGVSARRWTFTTDCWKVEWRVED